MGEVLEAERREGLNLRLLLGLDHQLQLSAPRLVLLDEILLQRWVNLEQTKKHLGASGARLHPREDRS